MKSCKDIKNIFIKFYKVMIILGGIVILMSGCKTSENSVSQWQPVEGRLKTRWAKEVSPNTVHQEYPRPQMVRESWLNLNGLWDYKIQTRDLSKPTKYDGKILVPFPVESALSGVGKKVGEKNKLWYRRTFEKPENWDNQRILLHFGAVDWESVIWINGQKIGEHRGGYDAFYFDITDALNPSGKQEIILAVWDPIEKGTQPRGKQVSSPRGIWYTSVTGIWQTVWLEPVNAAFIRSFRIETDIDKEEVRISTVYSETARGMSIEANVLVDGSSKGEAKSKIDNDIIIALKNPQLWSPDFPNLYDLRLRLVDQNNQIVDEVNSYFGMRKISLGKDKAGVLKLFLNNKELFHFGPLDQGWWPDGLYTAPTDAALRYDIEVTKQLGFNMARKHVKIEPARWYYWCDKLGLMVWQDMPSGDEYIGHNDPDIERTAESATQFKFELRRLMENFFNHPSIVMWVPYNEGWGQYDTPGIVNYIRELDPTRLINNTSGWADRGVGDVHDIHSYPGPDMPDLEKSRAVVLGEFGGLGLPVQGHSWQDEKNWGYRKYENVAELTAAYEKLIRDLYFLIHKGLAAAVYTQTTDVEIEVNGLMTYDRVIKMNAEKVARINQGYLPPIIISPSKIFLESSFITITNAGKKGQIRFTLDGTDPNNTSTVYKKPFKITESSTIKAITIWPDGTKSAVSEYSIEKVELKESAAVQELKPGLKCAYYENKGEMWSKLPDFNLLKASSTTITQKFDLTAIQRDENIALLFNGYIKVLENGIYTFYSESNDGSKLYIGEDLVVDNDFAHGMTEKEGDIGLEKGFHSIKVAFFQGGGSKGLVVRYQGPDLNKQEISSKDLYHKD